jgi:hypothetical protein
LGNIDVLVFGGKKQYVKYFWWEKAIRGVLLVGKWGDQFFLEGTINWKKKITSRLVDKLEFVMTY